MEIIAQIFTLDVQDSPYESTSDHNLAIIEDYDSKMGIYDFDVDMGVIPPEYDNIFEVNTSVFATSKAGRLALWTIKETLSTNPIQKHRERSVVQLTEHIFDRITIEAGVLLMEGRLRGERFYQAYFKDDNYLTGRIPQIIVVNRYLIIEDENEKQRIRSSVGSVLWEGTGSQWSPTQMLVDGSIGFPVFYDWNRDTYLWPVSGKKGGGPREAQCECLYYMETIDAPKWCDSQEIFCPLSTGRLTTRSPESDQQRKKGA